MQVRNSFCNKKMDGSENSMSAGGSQESLSVEKMVAAPENSVKLKKYTLKKTRDCYY